MSYNSQLQQYRTNTTFNASPLQLVIQLYDGAIKFIEKGKNSMLAKDFYEQNKSLQRAQDILMELIATLDHENGREISKNLSQIYTCLIYNLAESNTNCDTVSLERIKRILLDLRSAWAQIT